LGEISGNSSLIAEKELLDSLLGKKQFYFSYVSLESRKAGIQDLARNSGACLDTFFLSAIYTLAK